MCLKAMADLSICKTGMALTLAGVTDGTTTHEDNLETVRGRFGELSRGYGIEFFHGGVIFSIRLLIAKFNLAITAKA